MNHQLKSEITPHPSKFSKVPEPKVGLNYVERQKETIEKEGNDEPPLEKKRTLKEISEQERKK